MFSNFFYCKFVFFYHSKCIISYRNKGKLFLESILPTNYTKNLKNNIDYEDYGTLINLETSSAIIWKQFVKLNSWTSNPLNTTARQIFGDERFANEILHLRHKFESLWLFEIYLPITFSICAKHNTNITSSEGYSKRCV